MDRHLARCVLMLAVIFCSQELALGTTYESRDLTCPVCDHHCRGVSITSTNTFGGQDRDFLTRARGDQPLLLVPATCPKCGYSGSSDSFSEKVPADFKKKVLSGKALVVPRRPSSKTAPGFADLPPWARHDLIGQILALANAPLSRRIHQSLQTAWAVRLGDRPFAAAMDRPEGQAPDDLTGKTWREYRQKNEKQENDSALEIGCAEWVLANLGTFPQPQRASMALWAGSMLRTRGEHDVLLAAMPAICKLLDPKAGGELREQVAESIALERRYQEQALGLLAKALADPKGVKDQAERVIFTYLSGECARRLGRTKEALGHYAAAGKMNDCPDWLATWCKEQAARARRDAEKLAAATPATQPATRPAKPE